jgi:hypothetical protein
MGAGGVRRCEFGIASVLRNAPSQLPHVGDLRRSCALAGGRECGGRVEDSLTCVCWRECEGIKEEKKETIIETAETIQ